jgi:hypothetical protein
MEVTEIFFNNAESFKTDPVPYILSDTQVEYKCDGKEGSIRFDGYYYVEDHPPPYPEDDALERWERPRRWSEYLPKHAMMYMKRRSKEPCKIERLENGLGTRYEYTTFEEHAYIIEIYKRVIHEKTDRISEIEDDDGSSMDVCFFPTNNQTIYFRVVEALFGKKRAKNPDL